MFEKVNPMHPDKLADRIAGAIVDLAYKKDNNPIIAVEVLIGHQECTIIIETSVNFLKQEIEDIISRILGKNIYSNIKIVPQDIHLANNQKGMIKCGDNGIFKGVPVTEEQKMLSKIAREIYKEYPTDGKYILNNNRLIICQSNANSQSLMEKYKTTEVNPLGEWSGGPNVDAGATNRKLGSDMGDSVTGGGLHGKDLSKADVSVNIYAWLKAQETKTPQAFCCAIGDEFVNNVPYSEIVKIAQEYINNIGGFEKFAEWGLI
jgi:S-adenosylmethionine synthetase